MRIEQKPDCPCIRPEDEWGRQAVGILVNCLLGYSVEHDKGKEQQCKMETSPSAYSTN